MPKINIKSSAESHNGCVQSVVRALTLLDHIAGERHGLSLTELARRVELPRSTTHRLLTTMETVRYVAFDRRDNRWVIGVRACAVGLAADLEQDFGRIAAPVARALYSSARATVSVTATDGHHIRCVSRLVRGEERVHHIPQTYRSPVHFTAAGKAILACWADDDLEAFLEIAQFQPRTVFTVADAGALRREIHAVRDRGYAINDQEMRMGRRGVAAAVRDQRGRIHGSIGVSGSISKMTEARLPAFGAMVQQSAQRLGEGFSLATAA